MWWHNAYLSDLHQGLVHIHASVSVLQVCFGQLVLLNKLCVKVPAGNSWKHSLRKSSHYCFRWISACWCTIKPQLFSQLTRSSRTVTGFSPAWWNQAQTDHSTWRGRGVRARETIPCALRAVHESEPSEPVLVKCMQIKQIKYCPWVLFNIPQTTILKPSQCMFTMHFYQECTMHAVHSMQILCMHRITGLPTITNTAGTLQEILSVSHSAMLHLPFQHFLMN